MGGPKGPTGPVLAARAPLMNLSTPPVYDPLDPGTRSNPFPLYARLQDEDPLHWSPALRCWIVTRYDDVRQVTSSPTMSSDRLGPFFAAQKDERRDILSGVMRYLNLWLVFKAPPEHTRLRRLLNTVISPATVADKCRLYRSIAASMLWHSPGTALA